MKRIAIITPKLNASGHTLPLISKIINSLSLFYKFELISNAKIDGCTSIIKKENWLLSKMQHSNFIRKFPNVRRVIKFFNTISLVFFSNRIVKKSDTLILFDFDLLSIVLFLFLTRKLNVKRVVNIHSGSSGVNFLEKVIKKTLFKILNLILKDNDSILVYGELIKNSLISEFNVKEHLIFVCQFPSLLDFKFIPKEDARKKLSLEGDVFYLHFGMLRPDKNILKLVELFSNIKNENVKLLIVGSEAGLTKKNIIKEISEDKKCKFHLDIRYISDIDMGLYFSASDYLIMSYDKNNVSQSGPLSIAREYLLPVISTDVGEIGRYIKENDVGMVCDDVNGMDGLINDSLNRIGFYDEQLKVTKEKYSWNTFTKNLEKVL